MNKGGNSLYLGIQFVNKQNYCTHTVQKKKKNTITRVNIDLGIFVQ